MKIKKLADLAESLKNRPPKRLVAVNAIDEHTIDAINEAVGAGIITALLTGDPEMIRKTCAGLGIESEKFRIIPAYSEDEAALKAVELISSGKADIMMKGLLSTDKYIRAILNKDFGLLPPKGVLSHVTVVQSQSYHKLLIVGDVAIIPLPDLNQKIAITNYLIKTAHILGIENPKVGLLSASEQTLPKIPSSAEAAIIAKMAQRGQIKGAIVEGPLGFDMIIDRESALIKGVDSPVCGDADCILFPNIEAGNTFYKTIIKLLKSELGAIVMGARVPCVLTSRGDGERSKLYSIALAAMLA